MKMFSLASVTLATLLMLGCDGDSSPFEEAVEIRELNIASIEVVAPESSVADLFLNFGESVQFGVQGRNTASQVVELTASDRQWQVTDSSVALIDEDGRLVAQANGPVGVFVTIGGLDSDVYELTVSDANLVGINSILGDDSVDRCIPATYQATGDYDDLNPPRDLYEVEWSVAAEDEGMATIVSSPDINATLTGLTNGSITLTATAGGFSLQKSVTISNTLNAIAITPNEAVVEVDDTQNFVATGTYSDEDTADTRQVAITAAVNWEIVTGRDEASVSNVDDTRGVVTGVQVGNATLQASCGDLASATPAIITVEESESDGLAFNRPNGYILDNDSAGVFLRVSEGSSYSAADQLDNDDLDWEFTQVGDEDAFELTEDGDNAGFIVPLVEYGEGVVTVTDSSGNSASIDIEVGDS